MSGSLRLLVVLFLVCGIAAGSLAFVNAATKERIAEFARLEKIEAMQKVLPQAESSWKWERDLKPAGESLPRARLHPGLQRADPALSA
jgi:Na+-translocating ferredoxin:NAD+ oxidoreductase RnfG subunit